jgi:hypothetical protein
MVRAHRLKQYAPPQGDTSSPPCRLKSSASRGCGSVPTRGGRTEHGLVRLCRCTVAAWLRQRGPDAATLEPEPAGRQGALNTEIELVAMGARQSCVTDGRSESCVFLLWCAGLRYGASHT